MSVASAVTTTTGSAAPHLLAHQAVLDLNSGDTAWMIVATALVLFMTLPGLALFYGGMVRKKNLLSTLAQSVAVTVIVSVLWVLIGYTLSFGVPAGPASAFIGSLDAVLLRGVGLTTAYSAAPHLPEYLWIAYQMTFAIITPALIAGSIAERMKFSAFCLFIALWSLVVYAPVCHWVWGGGFLAKLGVLDFAGGSVVHVNSGVAGLVAALVLKPRRGFGRDNMAPHNLGYTMIGASMLLVGWLGFNAGSEWAADALASLATLNTIIATMTGAIGWIIPEWIERKQPTLLGMVSGMVVGLVAITPAAGFVTPGNGPADGPDRRSGLLCRLDLYQEHVPLRRQPRRLRRARCRRCYGRPADRPVRRQVDQCRGCRRQYRQTGHRPGVRDRLERGHDIPYSHDLQIHDRSACNRGRRDRRSRYVATRGEPARIVRTAPKTGNRLPLAT